MTLLDSNNQPLEEWQAVEAAVEAFERAYTSGGASDPQLYCPRLGHPFYFPILCELLRADLEFAWQAGRKKYLEDYRPLFPALFQSSGSLAQVAFEEYRLRQLHDELPSAAEYAKKYGIDVTNWSLPKETRSNPRTVALPEFFGEPSEAALGDRFPVLGELFLGYRIVGEIGRGAFAHVYLAEQLELARRLVVLKVSSRSVDESDILARLQHTNIVPIYSVHRLRRLQAVCMPYFGSTTLADVLRVLKIHDSLPESGEGFSSTVNQRRVETGLEPPPFTIPNPPKAISLTPLEMLRGMSHTEAVLWVGAEIANGLAHSHDRGILHRDLKPANILLADDGVPMLLDFNLASEATNQPVDLFGGTPSYMSPEQLAGMFGPPGVLSVRSDLYSLGLILYELLSGRSLTSGPMEGSMKSRVQQLHKERLQPFPSLVSLNPQVTPAIEAIVLKCLHPEPKGRYRSAHELRDDLRCQLEHRTLRHTAEPSPRERVRKFMKRNPWSRSIAFLGTTLAVVVLLTSIVTTSLIRQRQVAEQNLLARAFYDEVEDLKLSLIVPNSERSKAEAIQRGEALLKRYELPGPGSAKAELPSVREPFREPLQETYQLLAVAEASRNRTAEAENVETWLNLLQALDSSGKFQGNITALRQSLSKPEDWTEEQPMALLGLAVKNRPRELLNRLNQRPAGQLTPAQWVAMAHCYTALGQYSKAVSSYTTAQALYGKPSAALLAGRARAYLEQKQYDRAASDFQQALALQPDSADLLIDRALTLMGLQQFQQAVLDLDQALVLWPTHTRIYFIRAEARSKLNDLAGSQQDLQQGLKAEPGDEVSFISRGMAQLNRGQAEAALADFQAALKLNPKSRDAQHNIAVVFAEHQNKLEQAVEVLSRLIQDYPDFLAARGGRGVYLARLGRRSAAHADAKEVLKRQPPPFYRYQVAGIYALTSKTHPADAEMALRLIAAALQEGVGLEYVDGDTDLEPILKQPRFKSLVDAAKTLAREQGAK
jgi:eukaryotic-like serine/threonine-protein kinase